MKKTLAIATCFLLFLITISSVTLAENSVKFGVDTLGQISTDYYGPTVSNDTNIGITLSWEYINPIDENFSIGPGVECQLFRKADGASKGFCYLPIYWFARYNLNNKDGQNIYLVGKLGYDFLYLENAYSGVTTNGGIYFGVGAGTVINQKFEIEALYSICNGSISDSYSSASFNYSRLSVAAGFKF